MSAIAGKHSLIEVSTDNATWYTLMMMNDITMNLDGDNLDVTTFCNEYTNRTQGLKDVTWDASGFYYPDDADGQEATKNAFFGDTPLYARYTPANPVHTNSFSQQVLVSTISITSAVAGTVDISFSFEGTGEVTITS